MSFTFIKVKAPVTIQDSGRWHYQSIGVPVSGSMDDDSFFVANALVGNNFYDAALEIGMGEVELIVNVDTLVALSGKCHQLTINGVEMPSHKSILLASASVLRLKPRHEGAWSYLAIGGGVDVPEILSSRSTYLQAGFGGLHGKAISAGDIIASGIKSRLTESIQNSLSNSQVAKWSIVQKAAIEQEPIRISPGPEWGWLSGEQQGQLLRQVFRLSKDSNRMGYRLSGNPISRVVNDEMISSGVTQGTIQLTHDGNLIILMADSQTVGGYPRIAQVAAVDIASVAQMRAGEPIRFNLISQDEAEQLFIRREMERRQIIQGIRLKFA